MNYLTNDILVGLVFAYTLSGSLQAASQILANFENLIVGIIRGYRQPTTCEESDLLQDANLAILQRLKSYDPSRGALSTYIQAVVVNRLRRLYHQASRKLVTVSLDETDQEGESVYHLIADNNVETEALTHLSHAALVSKCRAYARDPLDQAVLTAIMQATPDAVVAKQHGVSRITVINRRNALLQRLRNNISEDTYK